MTNHSIYLRRFHRTLCAALAVIGWLVAVGCTPVVSPSPAGPAPSTTPEASSTQPPTLAVATPPSAVPTVKPPAAEPPGPSSSVQSDRPPLEAQEVVITGSDLGPDWTIDESRTTLDVEQAETYLRWSGNGDLSPEGLAAISSEVVVYQGASAAKGAMQPLDAEYQTTGAPEVGDSSRAYTGSVVGGLSVVFMEAVEDNVWFRIGVYGEPRSEIKVTRAAQLLERMISRLPRALTVEERPIVAATVDEPTHLEYSRRIAPEIREKRRPWREPSGERRVTETNQVLAPFGYRVAIDEGAARSGGPYFAVFQGDAEIAADIAYFGAPSVAADGSDFAMVLESASGPNVLLRQGSMEEWDAMRYAMARPVFVGTDLVSVGMDSQGQLAGSQRYAVMRNGEAVHRFDAQFTVDNPIKGLWSWDGRWVLEVDGQVMVDGKSLNQEVGYDEIFGWRLLHGEPFFFFEKGGEVGVSYAGEVLPIRYEEVIHYQCCEPAAFNLQGNDSMVWFHALRDGTWYYVEAGAYGPVVGTGSPLAQQ